jgi:hypothetical protein
MHMVSMPDVEAHPDEKSDSDYEGGDGDFDNRDGDGDYISKLFPDANEEDPPPPPPPGGLANLSGPYIVLLFLDWMSTNKVTDAAGQAAWLIIVACTSTDKALPSWHRIKAMLQTHAHKFVKRIEVIHRRCCLLMLVLFFVVCTLSTYINTTDLS